MDSINSEAFERRIQALMLQWHVPGVSIAAFDESRVTAKGFGLASIEPEIASTPETIFECASTTKSLTAAAVAKLAGDDQLYPHLTWATPVSELLKDEFVLLDAAATASTSVEDILSHRSGMPRHDSSYMGQKSRNPDTPQSITTNLRNLPLSASPRAKFQYCNMMFTVAAYLVEKMSQQSFSQFLQTNFFDVLGMRSTYVQPSAVFEAGQKHRYSKPYIWRKDAGSYEQARWRDQPEGQGAGLVQSTVTDYAKWVQAVMNKDESLLDIETWKELVKPRIVVDPEADEEDLLPFSSYQTYALGWEIEFYRGYRTVRHDGGDTGYSSLILFLPKLKFGLVIFGNAGGTGDIANIVAMELIDEILGVPFPDRLDWNERAEHESNKDADSLETLRKELSGSDAGVPKATSLPLHSFTGTYSNAGYHEFFVGIRDNQLYIDASDRGMPFTITFEHIRDDRIFIAHIEDDEYNTIYVRAEFDSDGNNDVQKMGVGLCEEISPSLIWFTKKI